MAAPLLVRRSLGEGGHPGWRETGHELARARDLVERVIKRVSEDMQSSSVAFIRNRELAQVERLAWGRDTLALLELQRGNLAAAEKYAQAAWLLFGHWQMAEHVGRIYDKQGRTAEALNYFALARRRASNPTGAILDRTGPLTDADLEKLARVMELHRVALVEAKTVSGTAQFIALVGPDRRASAVRLVKGDAALERLTGALERIVYPVAFPHAVTSRLLVPLEVRCVAAQGCAAHVATPDSLDLNSPAKK